jgi:hypothetical protein
VVYHHVITLSARASKVGGIVAPICLVVFIADEGFFRVDPVDVTRALWPTHDLSVRIGAAVNGL